MLMYQHFRKKKYPFINILEGKNIRLSTF